MRVLVSVFGALMILAGSVRAEVYTIKIKEDESLGDTSFVQIVEKTSTRVKVKTLDGRLLSDKTTVEIKEETYSQTGTRMKKGAKRPAAYKRAYTKAQTTKGGITETASYQGRTVLLEKRDGKYEVRVEGESPLAAKDLKALAQEANGGKEGRSISMLLPTTEVEVNETWPISVKLLNSLAGGGIDTEKSSGRGRLLKAYRKAGKQFGVVEFRLRIVTPAGKGVKWGPREITSTFDVPIDGSAAFGTMRLAVKASWINQIEREGEKYNVETTLDSRRSRTHRLGK